MERVFVAAVGAFLAGPLAPLDGALGEVVPPCVRCAQRTVPGAVSGRAGRKIAGGIHCVNNSIRALFPGEKFLLKALVRPLFSTLLLPRAVSILECPPRVRFVRARSGRDRGRCCLQLHALSRGARSACHLQSTHHLLAEVRVQTRGYLGCHVGDLCRPCRRIGSHA